MAWERLKTCVEEFLREAAKGNVTVEGDVKEEMREVLSWALKVANKYKKPRVAYLGPEGSYTEEATLTVFPQMIPKPVNSIGEVFDAVERGEAEFGVVPFANRLEGPVNETIDRLFVTPLKIWYDVEIPVRIVLASKDEKFERIFGHPMIFRQATRLLEKLRVETVPVSSTSAAAKLASEGKGACLCSPRAAELYNLKVLVESAEDNPLNATRFFVLSKFERDDGSKTSLLFTVPHTPGSLYKFLEPFARREINLTMVYSRPVKEQPWNYIFYVEFEGRLEKELERELRSRSSFLKYLGTYPSLSVER